jgi:sec-independent protein translocase protein TatB
MARQSELDELRKEVEAMRAAAEVKTPDLGIDPHLGMGPNLGLDGVMKADAEGAYINQWQASQAAAETPVAPSPAPEPVAAPESPKPKAARSRKPAASSVADESADAPKPRARKPKPAAEAGS